MSPSRRRWLKRIWIALSLVIFAATCAERAKPWLKNFAGARDAEAAPARHATSPSPSLRIASWNLQFLDVAGRGHEHRASSDYAALRRYAEALNADVVAVQEVASAEALAQLFSPSVYAYHLASQGGAQRTGFVFRKSLRTRVYPDLSELALRDLRAGSDLGVMVGARELRLLSIHLKAFCVTGPLDRNDRDCQKLNAQLPVLEGWVDARAREQVPFVVLGDFNRVLSATDDALFRALDDGDPRGLVLRRASLSTHSECRPGKRQHVIDHVLLGGPASGWLAQDGLTQLAYGPDDLAAHRKLSDHCPIHATLTPSALR